MNALQLSSHLTKLLFEGGAIGADSTQALFDVLTDALAGRPDVTAAVAADVTAIEEERKQRIAAYFEEFEFYGQDAFDTEGSK